MRYLAVALVLLLAGCAVRPPAGSEEAEVGGQPLAPFGQEVWAYHAHWMGETWRHYDMRDFGRILFFDLTVAKDGRIEARNGWPERWEDLRSRAREVGVPVEPVVSILGTDVFSAVFASEEARTRLVAEVVSLARGSGGVHLDVEIFEPVPPGQLAGFRDFVARLRTALDARPRKMLTAFVPLAANLYGEAELALLDAIVVQGYDIHWREGPRAGPVAALAEDSAAAWKPAAEQLARQGVSPRKVLFSTPLYGYEWPTVSDEARAATRAPADIITYAPVPAAVLPDLRINAFERAQQHGLRREPVSGSPWYALRDDTGWRQGWFDDPVSLAPRLDFVRAGDFRGVALFVLGYDGGALSDAALSAFRAGSARAPGSIPAGGR